MINQILLVFVGIFAIIGLITFLYGIVEGLSHEKKTEVPSELVVFVKNQESDVEGLLRQLSGKLTSGNANITVSGLSVVDYGSSDSTAEILKKLQADIDVLNFYTKDEYINHINNLNNLLSLIHI